MAGPSQTTTQPYGLKTGILSQWETLAQSLSSIAPTASPAMIIPLVIATSGRSSWLSYLLATAGALLVAIHVNVFAKDSASPGSLYAFVHEELGLWAGLIAGWGLIVAYICTAQAVTGGVMEYTQGFFGGFMVRPWGGFIVVVATIALAVALAYRNVELSTRFMLWIEAASIALIVLVFVYPGHVYPGHGQSLTHTAGQFAPGVLALTPIRAGLILATFSFVGFESATALGAEAKNPLVTIPRAVLGTTILSGFFFIFCAYAEFSAFSGRLDLLDVNSAPLQTLAQMKGIPWLAPVLSIGAGVSFFACALACITASARTAFFVSAQGSLPRSLQRAHTTNQTPHIAVVASGIASAAVPGYLVLRRASGFDLYNWLGTIATFGFVVAYLFVVFAAALRLKRKSKSTATSITLAAITILFLGWALEGSLNLGAPGPEKWLAPIFAAIVATGVLFGVWYRRTTGNAARTTSPPAEAVERIES
jgi:amino acid transporter